MKINLRKNDVVRIKLDIDTCSVVIKNKTFTEKISALDVARVGKKYDKKFKDSFIRNIYQRCMGIRADEYKMCIDYSFEA
jgi:hypothetical protein